MRAWEAVEIVSALAASFPPADFLNLISMVTLQTAGWIDRVCRQIHPDCPPGSIIDRKFKTWSPNRSASFCPPLTGHRPEFAA